MLKIKKSELRLYCDLLSQQSHEMKSLIQKLNFTKNTDLNCSSQICNVKTSLSLGEDSGSIDNNTSEMLNQAKNCPDNDFIAVKN